MSPRYIEPQSVSGLPYRHIDELLFESGLAFDLDLSHGTNRLAPPQRFMRLLAEGASRWGILSEYSPPLGCMDLRQSVARFETAVSGAEVAPENVVITNGASEGLALILGYLASMGAQSILIPGLQFPVVYAAALHAGLGIWELIDERRSWADPQVKMIVDAIAQRRPDIVLLTQPGNPSGTQLSSEEVEELFCTVGEDGWIIVDKVGSDIPSPFLRGLPRYLDIAKRTGVTLAVVDSLSKRRSCPGARLGYLVSSLASIKWIASSVVGRSTSRIAELAAIEDFLITARAVERAGTLSAEEEEYILEIFGAHHVIRSNYEIMVKLLSAHLTAVSPLHSGQNCMIGVSLPRPMSQADLVRYLLEQWHLGSYPLRCFHGSAQDKASIQFFCRVTLSMPEQEFSRTMERFRAALESLRSEEVASSDQQL